MTASADMESAGLPWGSNQDMLATMKDPVKKASMTKYVATVKLSTGQPASDFLDSLVTPQFKFFLIPIK